MVPHLFSILLCEFLYPHAYEEPPPNLPSEVGHARKANGAFFFLFTLHACRWVDVNHM